MMTRTLILALSLTIAATPAMAGPVIENTITTVRTNDLNLTHAADRERLDARLKSAANRICSTNMRGVAEAELRAQCMSAALANAAPQVERAIALAQDGTQLALMTIRAGR